MKRLLLPIILLSGLALSPLASADHNGADWRLSSRSGWGNEIWYRTSGERDWRRAPGSATAVGDGWVIGTDRRNGGYGIYRWNGFDWQRMPGAGIEIGGSYNNPWVVNDRGERFSWTAYGWREEPNFGGGRVFRIDRNDERGRGRSRRHDRDH